MSPVVVVVLSGHKTRHCVILVFRNKMQLDIVVKPLINVSACVLKHILG